MKKSFSLIQIPNAKKCRGTTVDSLRYLHLNCAQMENKLDELSHISGSRLRHRSSVACGDAESQVG